VFLWLLVALFFKSSKEGSFSVSGGAGLSKVSKDLNRQGFVSSAFVFRVYSAVWDVLEDCDKVYEGEYFFNEAESFGSIVEKLCRGKTALVSITIPEGLETREVLDILNNSDKLSGDPIVAEEEAIILPETYFFSSKFDRNKLFQQMKGGLNDYINKLWDERIRNDFIKTKQDLLILASIVEKEAKTDEERPIIAGIYLNRLERGMRLEACPTAFYEITRGKYKLNRPLMTKDTQIRGDYNTYRKKGLPIKPICNPGAGSIVAVLYPIKTNYLYFVAKADLSGHIFAEDYATHLKNIKAVKEEKRARGQQG